MNLLILDIWFLLALVFFSFYGGLELAAGGQYKLKFRGAVGEVGIVRILGDTFYKPMAILGRMRLKIDKRNLRLFNR